MMELTPYGGVVGGGVDVKGRATSPTLQFLLPRECGDEVFYALATMLPGVFRVSNPLVLRSDAAATATAPTR